MTRRPIGSLTRTTAVALTLVLALVGTRAFAADPVLPAPPPTVAQHVALVPFASGFERPVGLVFAPGDTHRLFVVEQTGHVRVLRDGQREPTVLVDVHDRLSHGNEQGLLGLAFHPKFAANGRLFIDYTDRHGDTHVVEYRIASGTLRVDPSSEHEWIFIKHPFSNHNGGNLVFGPDGKLYIGTGDGGFHGDPFANGQNPTSLLAKMLRLDVDTPGAKPEILDKGLRNPWRYSFDRKTGDLYIADVGQDKWEEIDVVPAASIAGRNFGWNVMEGLHCFSSSDCQRADLTLPVFEYSHKTGCSITGGYVYRGAAIPELDGAYFYSDYCTAILHSFRFRDGKLEDHWDWKKALDPEFKLAQISTFGEDASGELYVVSLEGAIYKIVRR